MGTLEDYAKENRARGDFPLVAEVVRTLYQIEIPVDKYMSLEKFEREEDCTPLYTQLEKETLASDPDYNGWCGCYITYFLDKPDDTPDEHLRILAKIQARLKESEIYLDKD